MKVEIIKRPTDEDWALCKDCALVTVGKEALTPPTKEWKRKIIAANHSPIRTLHFCFKLIDIPSWIATHLVRHVHAIPFVKTQRNDRQSEYDRRKAPQDTPVTMNWFMNAEELITISHKRLCHLASPETREVVQMVCNEVVKVNPEFEGFFEPMCYWKNGKCDEMSCCGYNQTYDGGIYNEE